MSEPLIQEPVSSMGNLVAHCGNCGCLFLSPYRIRNSTRSGTKKGNTAGCPNCGHRAAVVEGVFDAVGDVLTLIDGPQLTRDLMKKFADLVAQAQRQQITPDDLEREATKLDPKLGEAVAKARASGVSFWAGLLLLALATLHSCKLDAKLDLNRAFDQALSEYSRSTASSPAKTTGEE
jgi:hypothetical protein